MIELGNQALTVPIPGGGNATYPHLAASINLQAGNLTLITTPIGLAADGQWVRSGRPEYDGAAVQIANATSDPIWSQCLAAALPTLREQAHAADDATIEILIVNTLLPINAAPQSRLSCRLSGNKTVDATIEAGNTAQPTWGNLVLAFEPAVASYLAARGLPRKAV